jgi:hypothetical protein
MVTMHTKISLTIYKVIVIVCFTIIYFVCIAGVAKGIFLIRQPELSHPDKEDFFPVAVKLSSGIEVKNLRDVSRQGFYELACENSLKMHCASGNETRPYTTYSLDYFDGDYRYEVQYISIGSNVYPVSKKIGSVADLFSAVLYVTGVFVLLALITKLGGKLQRKGHL